MEKKKFLFVSLSSLIGDIAWQVQKEGHEVRYYIEAQKERDIADGFVPKSSDWEEDADWADAIVFDDTLGQGEKAQALRAKGKKVIGGTGLTSETAGMKTETSYTTGVICVKSRPKELGGSRLTESSSPEFFYRDIMSLLRPATGNLRCLHYVSQWTRTLEPMGAQ